MNDLLLSFYFILLVKYKKIFMVVGGKIPWMPGLSLGLLQQCKDFQRKHKIKFGKVPLFQCIRCNFFT